MATLPDYELVNYYYYSTVYPDLLIQRLISICHTYLRPPWTYWHSLLILLNCRWAFNL